MTAARMLLRVETTTGDDAALASDLTWDLMETLEESPAERVERASAEAEDGTKSGTAFEWTQLVVSFSGGLPVIVGLVQAWLHRQPGAKVRIELDGDSLEVEHASPELQDELARAFLARHPPAVPE
jgi:hypothetical protein